MRQRPPEQFGPYLIHEVIGIGGMATVHRAEKSGDENGTVALKRMLPQFADNEEAVEAFVREAKLARSMRHPNVARTYDSGRVDDVYFIAMELIEGRNLAQIAAQAQASAHPMPLGVTLNLAVQICEALDYAHTLKDPATKQPLGIIHRDISPSNVIVTDGGVAKLIDFGVAKGAAAGMQTRGITLKGKFAYMGPEYLHGTIDARADLFALGVMIHELLTNRALFAGHDDLETMTRLRELVVPPPSQANPAIAPTLDAVILRALERDPDARWQTASELRDALVDIVLAFPREVPANARAVADWITESFGETLTLGPTTTPTPVPTPITSLDLAPSPSAGKSPTPDPDLELAPSELKVRITPVKLDADDWARDTNISALVRAGDLGDPGAQPVSIEEPPKPNAAPAIPSVPLAPIPRESKPSLPPPVVVIAPNRDRKRQIILGVVLAVLAAAAAVYLIVLR